jgi:membrane protease YdiL (CAAX protease family)
MLRQNLFIKIRNNFGWVLLFGLLFLRIVILGIIGSFIHPDWLSPLFEVGTYLLTAIFIWWERSHLEEFHIDGIALILILTLKPIQTLILKYWHFNTLLTFPNPLAIVLWIIPFILLIILILNKFKFPKIRLNILVWIIIGFISGIVTDLITGYPMSFQVNANLLPYTIKQFISTLSPYLFIYQAGYAGISEEPLFRGILWGYLRRIGVSNLRILLIQTLLFMFGHIYYIKTAPFSLFIGVPIAAIVLGLLAWRSKSIATSIAAHATMNAIGYQIDLLFATIRLK